MIKAYLTIGDLPSWLALRGLKDIVKAFDVDLELHPLLASLGNVVSTNNKDDDQDPLEAYKARRAKARSDASARERERMCEMLAISNTAEYDGQYYSVALEWCREQSVVTIQQLMFLEQCFDAIHSKGVYGSMGEVEEILVACGIETEGFSDYATNRLPPLMEAQDYHVENGILSAPAFLVDDELFIGREHFPLIKWILAGRKSQPPV